MLQKVLPIYWKNEAQEMFLFMFKTFFIFKSYSYLCVHQWLQNIYKNYFLNICLLFFFYWTSQCTAASQIWSCTQRTENSFRKFSIANFRPPVEIPLTYIENIFFKHNILSEKHKRECNTHAHIAAYLVKALKKVFFQLISISNLAWYSFETLIDFLH